MNTDIFLKEFKKKSVEDIIKQHSQDLRNQEHFEGIGIKRSKKIYSEDEQTILEHFFTNPYSNVYCATDALPSELWALLMGQYARSSMPAKDRLLQLFTDMYKKNPEYMPNIDNIAETIKGQSSMKDFMSNYLSKAGKFIEEFGVKYGHASLRDSGTIRICFEGVSQLVTKPLEKAREGAYQEQSTRAIPFTNKFLGIPYELKDTPFEEALVDLNKKEIDLYLKIYNSLLIHLDQKFKYLREEGNETIKNTLGYEKNLTDKTWNGIIKGKAFDIARYLLPQNMTTSLGITLNTRRFQDMLTEWQSSEIEELRLLGKSAQVESMKINKSLMKYGNKSEYLEKLPQKRRQLFKKYFVDVTIVNEGMQVEETDLKYTHYDVRSKLINYTPEIENLILAGILFQGSKGHINFETIKDTVQYELTTDEKREIAVTELKNRKSHEPYPKSMEIGSFTFERFYDIGAFRDMQRQRGDRQQIGPYAVIGYNVPKEIEEIGMKKEFSELMEDVLKLYHEINASELSEAAQYIPTMAHMIRHVTTKDPVQCFYEAKLRAQPAGIDSYRSIAQQEIKQALDYLPAFKGLIPFDDNYYELGRLPETINQIIKAEESK